MNKVKGLFKFAGTIYIFTIYIKIKFFLYLIHFDIFLK